MVGREMVSTVGTRPDGRLYGGNVLVQVCVWKDSSGKGVRTIHLLEQNKEAILAFGEKRLLALKAGPCQRLLARKDEQIMREYNPDGMVQCPCRARMVGKSRGAH